MTPTRLPNQKRTIALLRWLRHNPQHSMPAALLTVYLCVWLFVPHHKPKPKISLPVPAVTGALPAPSAASIFSLLPDKPLFKHAAKIMAIEGRWDWEAGYTEYGWLSNHEFLYADYTQGGAGHIQHCRLFRYNTRTHRRTALKRLTKLVNCFYHSQMEISPDGKWLLWHGMKDDADTIDAATLDGRRHIQWPGGYYTLHTLDWTADSRHWIDFQQTTSDANLPSEAHIHDVNAPRKETVLPIAAGSLYGDYTARSSKNIVSLSEPNSQTIMHQLQVLEAQIGSRITPLHHVSIRPPDCLVNAGITECLLSPQGDRIAIIFCCDVQTQQKPQTYELWICRKDGNKMREVGRWRQDADRWFGAEAWHWLPDGRHLSFVYNQILWTIPAKN